MAGACFIFKLFRLSVDPFVWKHLMRGSICVETFDAFFRVKPPFSTDFSSVVELLASTVVLNLNYKLANGRQVNLV